jgi:L-lactate permease
MSNPVEMVKASLGWGILVLVGIFGYGIMKGEVTEANSFGFLAVLEILTIVTTAYCIHYLAAKSGGAHVSSPEGSTAAQNAPKP